MITRNSISERFGIILWFSIPADLCSKVYVWWTKHKLHFLIFLKTVCLANGLHHLFCSTDVHHEISHMYEYLIIIEFTCREPIIGHCSKLRWINIHSHPHISTISTCSETKVYNQFYEIWCPWRLSNLQKIHIPDNNYYSPLWMKKYCPAQNQTPYFGFAFRYAFWTSAHSTSRPLRVDVIIMIWKLSLDNTDVYINGGGVSTLFLSMENLDLRMNPESILTPETMCDVISLYHLGGDFTSSSTSNTMLLLVIFLSI